MKTPNNKLSIRIILCTLTICSVRKISYYSINLALLIMLCNLSACSVIPISHEEQVPPKTTIEDIINLDKSNYLEYFPDAIEQADIRLKAMVDAAHVAGAQQGYSERMDSLLQRIEKMSVRLDALFDFQQVMLLSNHEQTKLFLLPPVINEASNVVITDGTESYLTTASKTYQITQPAKLVISPPNWRSFLFPKQKVIFSPPGLPLTPETPEEKALWQFHVKKGYYAGITQADNEMRSRINNLKHDYLGMVRYLKLVDEGLVDDVKIDVRQENSTGNGQELNLINTAYTIVVQPSLTTNGSQYKAIITDDRGSLRYPEELTTETNAEKDKDESSDHHQ